MTQTQDTTRKRMKEKLILWQVFAAVIVGIMIMMLLQVNAQAATLAKINAGSIDTVDGWSADYTYSGGTSDWSRDWKSVDDSQVSNPGPEDMYNTERWGDFTYKVRQLTPGGDYIVRLHFSEFYWSQAGQRVFNVTGNNKELLSNFDIIKAAGGKNMAIARTFTVKANSNGVINLRFTGVTDAAKVSGIEVSTRETANLPPSTPTNLSVDSKVTSATLSWTASQAGTSAVASYLIERDGTQVAEVDASETTYTDTNLTALTEYSYRLRAKDTSGRISNYTNPITVTTSTAPASQMALTKINAGSIDVVDGWKADYGYTNGTGDWSRDWQTVNTSQVPAPGPEDMYNTERWGDFTYKVQQLTPGASYSVRLHFSEFYWSQAGQRVFNVSGNGTTLLTNFDIIKEAGGKNIAIIRDVPVKATSNGVINLQFSSVTDAAKVSGIEVFTDKTTSATPSAPTQLSATTTTSSVNLSWAAAQAGTSSIATYTVERNGVQIATVDSSSTSYTDVNRTASTTYEYRVRAKDTAGQLSPYSNTVTATTNSASSGTVTLHNPSKKEIAMRLVSSAENSSLNWKAQYRYIEDINDGRGYTGGIIGFTSGTSDMLALVRYYNTLNPNNVLKKYTSALENVDGTDSHQGLDPYFTSDWRRAADNDPLFKEAQNHLRDTMYFDPAVKRAADDGLSVLGQFIYYDAMVMHGPGSSWDSFGGMRTTAMKSAVTPAQGGDETKYLNAFLNVRRDVMNSEEAHTDTSRIDTAQQQFLNAGNFSLDVPLYWSVYGDQFSITSNP